MQPAKLQRPCAAAAVGGHVVGEHRVGQHGDMAEHVVEDVGLLQVVELVRLADEAARREAPVGQVVEEDVVGHETRNGHHRPAGQRPQPLIGPLEIGHAFAAEVQRLQSVQEGLAGPSRQHAELAIVKGQPGAVLFRGIALPPLRNGPVRRRPGGGTAAKAVRAHVRCSLSAMLPAA